MGVYSLFMLRIYLQIISLSQPVIYLLCGNILFILFSFFAQPLAVSYLILSLFTQMIYNNLSEDDFYYGVIVRASTIGPVSSICPCELSSNRFWLFSEAWSRLFHRALVLRELRQAELSSQVKIAFGMALAFGENS